ncbi:GNAT family N-acetyltransferase [Patescibacteria group bacterium]|nr:GNAT family N-acetyltransferase [Patescibacteria group bacterium]
MKKEIINDIRLCEELWNQFSPNTSIWDLWKTVSSFYDPNIHELYFILIEESGDRGLLPLYFDTDYQKHYFFGGGYPENRNFWFPIKMFSSFFEAMPEKTTLFDLKKSAVESVTDLYPEYAQYFSEKDVKYGLDLNQINHDLDVFFQRFGKKHYKNLRNDLKAIEGIPYRLAWIQEKEGIEKLTSDLATFNIERFGKESDFTDNKTLREFESLIQCFNQEGFLHTLTVTLNDKIVGIEMGAFFNGYYYVLNAGFDSSCKNLGKFMTLEHIKKSIELRAKEIDFLVGDTGWKQLWNLDIEPVYTFRKNT